MGFSRPQIFQWTPRVKKPFGLTPKTIRGPYTACRMPQAARGSLSQISIDSKGRIL
jgi:hypothetical protein